MRTVAVAAATVLAASLLTGCGLLSGATYQRFTVGECIGDPQVSAEGQLQVGELPIVDCAGAHWAEVYHVEEVTGADFPADLAVTATAVCEREFEGYVGAHFSQVPYDPSPMFPTEGSWEIGDRQIVCILVDDGGRSITGSAKGVGAA